MLRLEDKETAEFLLSEIFEVRNGVRLKKDDHIPGDIPFIGATSTNNGITQWVGNDNESKDSNVLGVNYNGSVLDSFYHPYSALFSDDVKRFVFKDEKARKMRCYLFISTVLSRQKPMYSYIHKFSGERISNTILTLPVTPTGEPDWEWMEAYIRQIEERERELIDSYLTAKRKQS